MSREDEVASRHDRLVKRLHDARRLVTHWRLMAQEADTPPHGAVALRLAADRLEEVMGPPMPHELPTAASLLDAIATEERP